MKGWQKSPSVIRLTRANFLKEMKKCIQPDEVRFIITIIIAIAIPIPITIRVTIRITITIKNNINRVWPRKDFGPSFYLN